ncbi:MAG: hypothetical protein IT270_17980 [Saprospiraceae bacterium]|nr:hypothetical protein [Saprospiraceae bacterium]MCC6413553.1 hypothetical protein [Saprospiraceae bacterium]
MRLFLILLLLPSRIFSQSNFLQNPDIVWAAEIEQDWVVDIPYMTEEWEWGLTTVKLLRTENNESQWQPPLLGSLILHAAKLGKLPLFRDAACTLPADTAQVLMVRDSFIVFDPDTYEEKMVVEHSFVDTREDIVAWRLRQVVYYNATKSSWQTQPSAIAPLIRITSYTSDSLGLKPLFWIKVEATEPKLESNNIVWAKKTKTTQRKTKFKPMESRMVKLIDAYQQPMDDYIKAFAENKNLTFYDGFEGSKPLDMMVRYQMVHRTDTVVTFDPENYEEKIVVVNNDINSDQIKELRLVQTWFWDERKSRLFIHLDAVAPMFDVMDDHGNFRYQTPLFYQKTAKPGKKKRRG